MSYTNWTAKSHGYITDDQWARLDDLMYIFSYIRSAQLKYRSHRGEGIRLIRNICKTYSIEQHKRFPAFKLVNMSKSFIADLFMQLLRAIDVVEFSKEQHELTLDIIRKFFDKVTQPNFSILVIYGVFDRKTFEKYHQLVWEQQDSD